jgi:hypothetical protein
MSSSQHSVCDFGRERQKKRKIEIDEEVKKEEVQKPRGATRLSFISAVGMITATALFSSDNE